MPQGRKGKVNYRCPVCFDREWDIDMLFDNKKDEYYCLRCSFTGNEQEVQRLNAQFREKYRQRSKRIVDF